MNSLIKQKQNILLQTKHQQEDNVLVFLLPKDNWRNQSAERRKHLEPQMQQEENLIVDEYDGETLSNNKADR